MRKGKVRNRMSSEVISVTAAFVHLDSCQGKSVWVHGNIRPYCEVDCSQPHSLFEVIFDMEVELDILPSLKECAFLRNYCKRMGDEIGLLLRSAGLSQVELAERSGLLFPISVRDRRRQIQYYLGYSGSYSRVIGHEAEDGGKSG